MKSIYIHPVYEARAAEAAQKPKRVGYDIFLVSSGDLASHAAWASEGLKVLRREVGDVEMGVQLHRFPRVHTSCFVHQGAFKASVIRRWRKQQLGVA